MKPINRRFEVIFTQDDNSAAFHILLDKETKIHYLWITTETGMALSPLSATDPLPNINLSSQP